MLVLIDESGDPAFKIAKGSTSHFVIALVAFDDFKEAERAAAAIADLRTRLHVKPEFKFAKSADPVRDAFFDEVCSFHFTARALVVDKAKVYSEHLRADADQFYNYFLQLLLKHDGGLLRGANVKLDGSGSKEFRQALNTYLRAQLREGQIGKFKFADSAGDDLIQLADMVAGAILRSYRGDDRKNAWRWRTALARAGRLGDVWDFL
ncbi:MAG: DUF3800 domain-containing protein [Proteobacteria bacterium]|nr:DUF3800 domain-containing protein [Pseudomonadota bacterium]